MTAALESVRQALAGRYEIDCEIGRGASAAVYLAEETIGRRAVAVKVLHAELAQALGAQRFLREIRVVASLSHPHLVPIEDSGQLGDVFFYVSPYLPDGSLRTRLRRERQLSVEEAIRIARDVGDALQYVHSHGIVHRDVKPENILFSSSRACVADFGIARAMDAAVGETITSTGLVVGTPTYMSPEQASGDGAVDARSDQYSLACVVYEMIAGVPPFIGATAQAVIAQRFAHAALPLSHYRPTVAAQVEAAIGRALSLTPADRFATVGAFVHALGDPASMGAAITTQNVAERVTRRRWVTMGAAAGGVALAAVLFTQAYPRVRAALSPAVDTTRFVVLPFEGGSPTLSGRDAASAAYASLKDWRDIALVDDVIVSEAIGARRTSITSPGEALGIAAALGAGRLIWGKVADEAGQMRVRLDLYDVARRSRIRDTTVEVASGSDLASHLPLAVDVVLRLPELRESRLDPGTRSFLARRAFERGELAYNRGDFAAALERYTEAAAADPEIVRAHARIAMLGSLLLADSSSDEWREAARRAAAGRQRLTSHEAEMTLAFLALAERRYPEACEGFSRARVSDSTDFVAWYGLGECRVLDSLVVPSTRSRSGWAFRSSFHSAARAYHRAAELDQRVFGLPVYARLERLLKSEPRTTRAGFSDGLPRARFASFPEMSGDTLAYVAFPSEGAIPARAWPSPEAHQRALQYNGDQLLAFARAWVRRRSNDPDALHALATALETRGEATGGGGERMSALTAVQRARRVEKRSLQWLQLGVRQVRLHLKRAEFSDAAMLGDTILSSPHVRDSDQPSVVHGVAALLGRTALTAQLGVADKIGLEIAGVRLVPDLAARSAALDAYAALGACQQLRPARSRLSTTVAGYVNAERADSVLAGLQALPAMWSVPCTRGGSTRWSSASSTPLVRAQRAFAAGDQARALGILDTAQADRRSLRPGDVSLDFTFQEAWIRAASGDTLGAIGLLDRVLESLSTQGTLLLTRMSEAAALPRAMILRADLAAAVGDRQTARRWAAAASELWAGADADLATESKRMRAMRSP